VPFKRYDRPGLCYLDKPEMDALWPRQTARPSKAVVITARCCSSTIPGRVPVRPRLSPLVISTCDRMVWLRCGSSAKAARHDTARSGPRP
jgi:hypothetical protein